MVASKIKKKRSTPGFPWVVLHNRDWTSLLQIFFRSCSKLFSALEIKDNSKFNKGQGRGVQIKDGWQPYPRLSYLTNFNEGPVGQIQYCQRSSNIFGLQ